MFQFLSIKDLMNLIQVVSKAAEFEEFMWVGLMQEDQSFEAHQWREAIRQAIPVLAKIDREQPGFMPVPHDGVQWKDRE